MVPIRAVFFGADIGADDASLPRCQPRPRRLQPAIVEAHAVDHRPILGEAKKARLRIALLRPRGQGPHLDEAEAEAEHLPPRLGVLVEARRKSHRVRKIHPGHPDRKRRIGPGRKPRRHQLQSPDRQPVRPLGIEREGQRPEERIERHQASHPSTKSRSARASWSALCGTALFRAVEKPGLRRSSNFNPRTSAMSPGAVIKAWQK